MLREVKKGPQLADEDDYYKYVYVLDVSELGNIPFDVNNMRRVAEETSDRHYNIIVGASYGVHLLTKIVSRFTDYEVRFADDMDECLKMAREFLAQMEKE